MKITTFDPVIISRRADETIRLFEELGFEKTHTRTVASDTETEIAFYKDLGVEKTDAAAGSSNISVVIMKDADGHHVEVNDAKEIPQDFVQIRMNVDDLEKACDILTAHGFRNTRGNDRIEVKKARGAMMVSPSGLRILVIKHLREE